MINLCALGNRRIVHRQLRASQKERSVSRPDYETRQGAGVVRSKSILAFPISAALLLAGCATVTTKPIASADAHDPGSSFNAAGINPGAGITYFLPRQLAQVTVTRVKQAEVRVPKQMADALKAQAEAQDAVDATTAALVEAQARVNAAEDAIVSAASASPDGMAILNARLQKQQAELASAKADLAKAQDNFVSATNAIKALDLSAGAAPPGPIKQDYIATVEITLLPPSADPAHGFRLNPNHSWLRDDSHHLAISSAGLLTTSNIVAVDRTGDVIVALAQAAGAVSGLAGGPAAAIGPGPTGPPPAPDVCLHVPDKVSLIVDFASATEVNEGANKRLHCMGVRFENVPSPAPPVRAVAQSTAAFDGIAYRTPVEQWVRVQVCAKDMVKDCNPEDTSAVDTPDPVWRTSQVIALRLPQAGPISYLSQKAGFFTRTSYDAVFQDGMLTSYDDSRPSEVLQVAGLPIRVIDSLFDGVSHVISLRTGIAKAQTGLTQEQTNQLSAQYDLLTARIKGNAAISDAQKANLESQVALAKAGLAAKGSLADAQAALLQQQTNLIIAQTNAPTQVLDSRVTNTVQSLKDQAKLDQIRTCVAAQRAANQPIDPCLN